MAANLDTAVRAKLDDWLGDICGAWDNGCAIDEHDHTIRMRAAIVAVLDLHKPRTAVEGPLEGKPICDECSDGTNEWLATADPCPTKRAIAEKLGVEVDDA